MSQSLEPKDPSELLRAALLDITQQVREHLRYQASLGADGIPSAAPELVALGRAALTAPRGPSPDGGAASRPAPLSAPGSKQAPSRSQTRAEPGAQRAQAPSAPVATSRKGPATSSALLGRFQELSRGKSPVPVERPASLEEIRSALGDCTRCKLHQRRRQIVFGQGNPKARLLFIGEGPGAEEDRQGLPFVGRSGQLLTRIIAAMGLSREEVYIANIVKCRPPNNRDPELDEVASCEPFLLKQIAVIEPEVIVAVGRVAAHALLKIRTPITRLRGNWQEYRGIPVMPTLHPAYLLRQPAAKRQVWNDMKDVMKRLGLPLPPR